MGEVLAVNPTQRDVIALCRETLREAEAGTLSGVVILGTYADGMLSRSEAGDGARVCAPESLRSIPRVPAPMAIDDLYPDDNPKTVVGVTKAPLHLVPPVSIAHEAMAFADGAKKYGPYNWRDRRVSASVYVPAAIRHITSWWDGEDLAADSLVNHLAHAKACLSILLDAAENGMLNDDRPTPGKMAEVLQRLQQTETPE